MNFVEKPKPSLYIFVASAWIASLFWFHPRMMGLLDMAGTPFAWGALLFFILFTEVAWLYAFFNVGVIIFASIYRRWHSPGIFPHELPENPPGVAILYTTANDFVEASANSCVMQEYPNFTVYILDDSSDPDYRARIDDYAAGHPERVRVIRRSDRKGFKAGNLNHGLANAATMEPFFALVDADEILPTDFLLKIVPRLAADEKCGFVQANHRSNPDSTSPLAKYMGVGIDIHWKWYHPLRNRYGFVMLLGHGAVIRRQCWEEIGGFPELVSEDLAFALSARKLGWRGYFEENVICFEDFPESVRAFRVRHMKWTRGTCEFLFSEMRSLLRSRNIPLVEKLDILFPTLNLPLSLLYFLFVVDANLILASLFGHTQPLTVALGDLEFVVPTLRLESGFAVLNTADFYFITLMTLLAPVLCFVIDMWRRPGELFRFLSRSTALYGALGPLSSLGVLFYLVTGKAIFHVTADRNATWRTAVPQVQSAQIIPLHAIKHGLRKLLAGSHPDHPVVQGFEILCGIVFCMMCIRQVQISFFGLALGFILLPVMHHLSWEHPIVRKFIYIPFILIIAGITLGGLSLAGMETVLFGFGFHF